MSIIKRGYWYHISELRNEELNIKKIIAAVDATFAVAKRRPEKTQFCTGLEPLTSTIPVSQRSRVRIPYKPEFFSGFLLFSTIFFTFNDLLFVGEFNENCHVTREGVKSLVRQVFSLSFKLSRQKIIKGKKLPCCQLCERVDRARASWLREGLDKR